MMMDDLDDYDKNCERIRAENRVLLDEFENWLRDVKGLRGEKTITTHVDNVDFYINTCLLYSHPEEAKEGVGGIGFFLGYWFIKKALWSSEESIKSNATSLKKFYTFMHERGDVKEEDLDQLKVSIKEEMPEWIATMQRYDDPEITDMEEVWRI